MLWDRINWTTGNLTTNNTPPLSLIICDFSIYAGDIFDVMVSDSKGNTSIDSFTGSTTIGVFASAYDGNPVWRASVRGERYREAQRITSPSR